MHPVVTLLLKAQHSSSSLFHVVAVCCCCTVPYFLLTFCWSTVRQWHISRRNSTFRASKGRVSSSLKQAFKWRRAFKVLCDKRTEEEAFTYWCWDKLWLHAVWIVCSWLYPSPCSRAEGLTGMTPSVTHFQTPSNYKSTGCLPSMFQGNYPKMSQRSKHSRLPACANTDALI